MSEKIFENRILLILCAVCLLIGFNPALAQQTNMQAPDTQSNKQPVSGKTGKQPVKWSMEFKGGRFKPAIENWDEFYGNDKARFASAAFGYRAIQQLEIGIEIGWMKDNGQGFLPANNQPGGRIKYQLVPVSAYLLLRGVFMHNQWIVPYAGGGWTRAYYRANIVNQSTIDGVENGTHVRAGLQVLLNNIDKKYAANLKRTYGINNVYFIIEGHESKVELDSGNDLGGRSYQAGILLEF